MGQNKEKQSKTMQMYRVYNRRFFISITIYKRVKTLFLTDKHQKIKPLFDIKAIIDKQNI